MGKCLKNTQIKAKQIKKKTVVTIIFYGKLWSCKRAYIYKSLERTPIWEYLKIGPWFEIMTSVDADLRSGRRLETGRWRTDMFEWNNDIIGVLITNFTFDSSNAPFIGNYFYFPIPRFDIKQEYIIYLHYILECSVIVCMHLHFSTKIGSWCWAYYFESEPVANCRW
jgi:hypothetical protein